MMEPMMVCGIWPAVKIIITLINACFCEFLTAMVQPSYCAIRYGQDGVSVDTGNLFQP